MKTDSNAFPNKLANRFFGVLHRLIAESQANRAGFSGSKRERVMGRDFRPLLLGIDRVFLTVNDKVVDAVFHVRGRIGRAEQPLAYWSHSP